jgi:hypothetical protein
VAGREGDWPQDESSDLPVELQTELVHAALTDHYQRVLDEPIPIRVSLRLTAVNVTSPLNRMGRVSRQDIDW